MSLHHDKPAAGAVSPPGATPAPGGGGARAAEAPASESTSALEMELRDLRAELCEIQSLNRLKDQYLTVATHELSAPLTSMKAYLEALQEHYEEPGFTQGREFLGVLGREMDRLIRIVDRTLEISRLTRRGLQVRPQTLRLQDTLAEVAASLLPILSERAMRFEPRIPVDLPQVRADPDLLKQVLINLVHNAVKFSPAGRTVWVEARELPDAVQVEVRDEGFGIVPEEIGHVFEAYFRSGDGRVERERGTGLGLTIVKTIVESHGGHIGVESVPDGGTTFLFTVPKT